MSYPEKKSLDGFYTVVERDGKCVTRCWTDLTDEERKREGKWKTKRWWRMLAEHLGEQLRAMADQFGIVGEDE